MALLEPECINATKERAVYSQQNYNKQQFHFDVVAEHCYTRAVLQHAPARQMATASAARGSASTQLNDPTGIHRYKLAPPLFDGDYSK